MQTSEKFTVKQVQPEDWEDFEALFESRGGPKNCWCMVWRPSSVPKSKLDKASRKAAMQSCVHSGKPVGLLAYAQGEAVGWCSVGPRQSFINLGGGDAYEDDHVIWSLTCFFVKRPFREQGLANRLIHEAVAYARAHSADYLEAYPVDPASPSYRFAGFVPQFEKHGFKMIGTAGTRRHVYHLKLTEK